ncbi:hypothetical protein HDU93_003555 [Gonapodya sp. JEL0774]|nr:hypothetical protein HDU93_003555 [Gonapodya sp. JEL0774]
MARLAGLDAQRANPQEDGSGLWGLYQGLRRRVTGETKGAETSPGASTPPLVPPPASDSVNEFGMDTVCNFRDVLAGKVGKGGRALTPGLIFRSATMDMASVHDTKTILDDLGVRTILDLRRKDESGSSDLHKPFRVVAKPAEINAIIASLPNSYTPDEKPTPPPPLPRTVFKLDLMSKVTRALMWEMKWWEIVVFIVLMLCCLRNVAVKFAVNRTIVKWDDNLAGMSKRMMEKSREEMRQAFLLLSYSSTYPLVFHCSAGKDRTGLVALLLLTLLGVPRATVLWDFQRSELELASVRWFLVEEVEKQGLGKEWAEAPSWVAERVLEYVDGAYGGVEGYLESIGITEEDRARIKANFTVAGVDARELKPPAGRGGDVKRRGSVPEKAAVSGIKVGVAEEVHEGIGLAEQE